MSASGPIAGKTPGLRPRLKAGGWAAIFTFGVPLLVMMMVRPDPEPWPDNAVMMEWAPHSAYEGWLMWAGVVCTVPAAVLGFLIGLRNVRTWVPSIALVAAACLAAIPALQSWVRIDDETIVRSQGWPGARRVVATSDDLAAVEVTCWTVRRQSRWAPKVNIAAVDYVIHFRDGTSLSLLEGLNAYSPVTVSRWIEAVDRIDRSPLLRAVGRFDPEAGEGGWCLPRIRAGLEPNAARIAERLLTSAQRGSASGSP